MTLRRSLLYWFLLGSIVVAIGWGVVWYFRGSYRIVLETPTAKAGDVITIRQDYRRAWSNSGMSIKPENIQILDASGKNLNYETNQQLKDTLQLVFPKYTEPENSPARQEFFRQWQEGIASKPGFIEETNYQQVIAQQGITEYIGCPLGLGRSTSEAPSSSTERQSFRVFPGTPAGVYRMIIPDSYYCGSGPAGEFTFRVEK